MLRVLIKNRINICYIFFSIFLLSVSSCKPFESCTKNFLITGKVIDQSSNPITDVKIRWHYADSSTPENILGYTDSNGDYSISHSNMGGLQGAAIEFVKAGYATQISQSYSESEAGSQLCGGLTLTRNVTLAP
ncbi:MAG: hypothetical protein AABY53_04440 [Bdellovibrionota bacterium]